MFKELLTNLFLLLNIKKKIEICSLMKWKTLKVVSQFFMKIQFIFEVVEKSIFATKDIQLNILLVRSEYSRNTK